MNLAQAMLATGRSRAQLLKMVRDGLLPKAHKDNRDWYFDQEELERVLGLPNVMTRQSEMEGIMRDMHEMLMRHEREIEHLKSQIPQTQRAEDTRARKTIHRQGVDWFTRHGYNRDTARKWDFEKVLDPALPFDPQIPHLISWYFDNFLRRAMHPGKRKSRELVYCDPPIPGCPCREILPSYQK